MNSIIEQIENAIEQYRENCNYTQDPKYILMDYPSYFQFKIDSFGDDMIALEEEIESFDGLEIFYNNRSKCLIVL